MAEPRLLRCGWHVVLVEFDGLEQVLALADAVRAAVVAGEHGYPDVIDVVPAATTVLVIVRDGGDITALRRAKDRNFPAKASYEEPSRSRPAASPSCFWPIIR